MARDQCLLKVAAGGPSWNIGGWHRNKYVKNEKNKKDLQKCSWTKKNRHKPAWWSLQGSGNRIRGLGGHNKDYSIRRSDTQGLLMTNGLIYIVSSTCTAKLSKFPAYNDLYSLKSLIRKGAEGSSAVATLSVFPAVCHFRSIYSMNLHKRSVKRTLSPTTVKGHRPLKCQHILWQVPNAPLKLHQTWCPKWTP